jgi:exo-1,4-beta-D-glucosaminidase
MRTARAVFALVLFGLSLSFAATKSVSAPPNGARQLPLADGWAIRSSCETQATGPQISQTNFKEAGWLATKVPSTVMAAQVNAGKFEDPYFGMNMRKIPGTDYPLKELYANLPVTANSPYKCSWWYRKDFNIPASWGKSVWIHFNGINYRGNLWVNGKQVATDEQIRGAYRTYDFDITPYIQRGKPNAVAVETFIPTETDLGINFVDWQPTAADKNMGLWRDVYLADSGAITLGNPAVLTHFTDDNLSTAELTVVADVENHSESAVETIVRGTIGTVKFEQKVALGSGEKKVVRFEPAQFAQLRISNPKVWWPYQYGRPTLHNLKLTAAVGNSVSDEKSSRFGIREFEGKLNDKGFMQFRVNRKNILIRGGGWGVDVFYREPKERLEKEFQYVKAMNLNTVRLEGKLGTEDLFNIADEMGVMIMAGWCCCDHWEHWDKWAQGDLAIANASLYSQISRLRAHPSVFVWLNGSDGPPPPNVESTYIATLKERDWPNPFISSASQKPTTVTGPSGVKMTGPYDYVPPEYWYVDKSKEGGAYGFNTETSPGPAIPSVADIKRTLPKESWWPQDAVWAYHGGLGSFAQYANFNTGMNAQYGEAKDLNDYARKAQWMAYDGERAMFEAYSANKYTSTGVIQWMLNNGWPSFIWHLYDYYLVPGGGYFGTKKANEPLHIQYRFDDRNVIVVNSELAARDGVEASARLFDLDGKEVFSKKAPVSIGADAVVTLFPVPAEQGPHFLKLELKDRTGKTVSDNFYVVGDKLAEFDWAKTTYVFTPATSFANYRDLEQLKPAQVSAKIRSLAPRHATVQLTNNGKSVAFMVHAGLVKPGSEEEIAPVLWNDNFVSLLPGESRALEVELPTDYKGKTELHIDGWNVAAMTIKSTAATIKR